MGKFRASIMLLLLAKFVGISSPFILKGVVNGLTETYGSAAVAGATVSATAGRFTLAKVCGAIGLWGFTRLAQNALLCIQMNAITEVIQSGIKRVATATFSHLHDLDLNYHR